MLVHVHTLAGHSIPADPFVNSRRSVDHRPAREDQALLAQARAPLACARVVPLGVRRGCDDHHRPRPYTGALVGWLVGGERENVSWLVADRGRSVVQAQDGFRGYRWRDRKDH